MSGAAKQPPPHGGDNIPASLKVLTPYVKLASDYAERDPTIRYWCLFKAVEDGMRLDSGSPQGRDYLMGLLETLEKIKASSADNDAIKQQVVGQAYIEDHAQKLLNYAESQDGQGIYNLKVVKAYYTAACLFEVLSTFGELDENTQGAKKYAKWRATHINQCLKSGEKPTPGNRNNQLEEDEGGVGGGGGGTLPSSLASSLGLPQVPQPPQQVPPHPPSFPPAPSSAAGTVFGSSRNNYDDRTFGEGPQQHGPGTGAGYGWHGGSHPTGEKGAPGSTNPPPHPTALPRQMIQGGALHPNAPENKDGLTPPAFSAFPPHLSAYQAPGGAGISGGGSLHHQPGARSTPSLAALSSGHHATSGRTLKMEDFIEAKKHVKYALSALDYDDAKTAVEQMREAIGILESSAGML